MDRGAPAQARRSTPAPRRQGRAAGTPHGHAAALRASPASRRPRVGRRPVAPAADSPEPHRRLLPRAAAPSRSGQCPCLSHPTSSRPPGAHARGSVKVSTCAEAWHRSWPTNRGAIGHQVSQCRAGRLILAGRAQLARRATHEQSHPTLWHLSCQRVAVQVRVPGPVTAIPARGRARGECTTRGSTEHNTWARSARRGDHSREQITAADGVLVRLRRGSNSGGPRPRVPEQRQARQ